MALNKNFGSIPAQSAVCRIRLKHVIISAIAFALIEMKKSLRGLQNFRLGGISHHFVVGCLLLGGLLLTVAVSLTNGSVPLTIPEVVGALLGRGTDVQETIVWDLRLPRTIAALTVGAALGMAGTLLQGMLRNDLAEPYLLGISAGSGLLVVAILTLGWVQFWVPLAAWSGAALTALLVFAIAWTPQGIVVERLILGGVAVSALFGSVQAMLLLLADDGRIQLALNWLIGGLNGRGWTEVTMAGPYIGVALLLGCLLARSLNLLSLGDELAMSLGISLGRSRLLIGACATLLAAGAVSMSGLIGFVGLMVPHGVRLLVGTDYRWVLPLSAIAGALVLNFADLIARLGAVELPTGVVTALMGSPLLIWLLYRRQRHEERRT